MLIAGADVFMGEALPLKNESILSVPIVRSVFSFCVYSMKVFIRGMTDGAVKG